MSGAQPVNHPNSLAGQLRIDATDTTQFGVYSTGTVKKHPYGLRYRVGDRVFHYGKSIAALTTNFGAKNYGVYNNITGGVVTARAIGDTWLDILLDATTGAATWFGTKNEMVGGMLVMANTAPEQFRMITGHEKGANTATIKVYLDGPLTGAAAAAKMVEAAQNPYANLSSLDNTYSSVMGIPSTDIASGSHGWLQSWGPCWVTPFQPVADTAHWRTVVFRGDGSIGSYEDITGETGHQVAGFVIDKTSGGGDNPPFIFLQISPF